MKRALWLLAWWFTVTFSAGDPRGEEQHLFPTKDQCERKRALVVAVMQGIAAGPVGPIATVTPCQWLGLERET